MNNNERIKKILILINSLVKDITGVQNMSIELSKKIYGSRRALNSLMFSNGDLEEVFKDFIPLDQLGKFESEARSLIFNKNYTINNAPKDIERFITIKNIIKTYCTYKNLKIFYSWQSNLPSCTNRGFIQIAIQNAINEINKQKALQMYVDSDTRGECGSPNIGITILRKIDNSDVFICDVTSIGKIYDDDIPNPNVLFELGYALKHLGESKIIMLYNSAFGKVENLPFDLNNKRITTYKCSEDEEDKTSIKKRLTSKIKEAIELILGNY